tara:strand:+ start:55134 stop:55613 length:480 start_codon:yes stop_codon:yes gene_type:complete
MTEVLGVDPGLGATGFSLLNQVKNKTSLIAYGLIKPPIKFTIEKRLNYLFVEISKVIDRFNPSTLAIEDAFYSKNVKSAMRLGQARGVIILAAAQANIDVYEYAPRKVKQAVCGNGAASKEQIQYMVMNILNLEKKPKSLDISDAMAVGICYLNELRIK